MVTSTQDMARFIYEQAQELPPESLRDLAQYVEFLRFKAGTKGQVESPAGLRVVKLRGLLKGVDVSPEMLAAVRQEMWGFTRSGDCGHGSRL